MWVKRISPEGVIEHMYWKRNYEALMRAADVEYPGYIYYEAGTMVYSFILYRLFEVFFKGFAN